MVYCLQPSPNTKVRSWEYPRSQFLYQITDEVQNISRPKFVIACLWTSGDISLAKEISIAIDLLGAREPLAKVKLREYLLEAVPGADLSDGFFAPEQEAEGEWVFIMCNAAYIPVPAGPQLNHWIPAITEENVGSELFLALQTEQDAEITAMEASLELEFAEALTDDKDDAVHLAMVDELGERLKLLKHRKTFIERCRVQGLRPIFVPGDGNCFCWSLKVLRESDFSARHVDLGDPADVKGAAAIRRQLSQGWKLAKELGSLQQLYLNMYGPPADALPPDQVAPGCKLQAPVTPKRHRQVFTGTVDLLTPPSQDKQSRVRRVQACNRAPNWPKPLKASPTLASKGTVKKDAPTTMKAEMIVSGSEKKQKKQNEDMEVDEPEVEEMVDEVECTAVILGASTQRKKRRRIGRKKEKTDREKRLDQLKLYLASIGVDHGAWMSAHWRPVAFNEYSTI